MNLSYFYKVYTFSPQNFCRIFYLEFKMGKTQSRVISFLYLLPWKLSTVIKVTLVLFNLRPQRNSFTKMNIVFYSLRYHDIYICIKDMVKRLSMVSRNKTEIRLEKVMCPDVKLILMYIRIFFINHPKYSLNLGKHIICTFRLHLT